jgi:uncharacterized protein with PIN domain
MTWPILIETFRTTSATPKTKRLLLLYKGTDFAVTDIACAPA